MNCYIVHFIFMANKYEFEFESDDLSVRSELDMIFHVSVNAYSSSCRVYYMYITSSLVHSETLALFNVTASSSSVSDSRSAIAAGM